MIKNREFELKYEIVNRLIQVVLVTNSALSCVLKHTFRASGFGCIWKMASLRITEHLDHLEQCKKYSMKEAFSNKSFQGFYR